MEFGALLHRHRRAGGLTQEQLAAKAGVSLAAIGALERGVRRYPRRATVDALAYALGLGAEEREIFATAARRRGGGGAGVANGPAGSVDGGADTGPVGGQSIALADAPARSPQQLPLADLGFTGRVADLEALRAALRDDAGPAVAAVTGMGGVGKTTLAVRAAHDAAEQYPDGQVYLDLQGYSSDDPVAPIEALDYLLRSFGLSGQEIPLRVDQAAARLRTLLADRRALILLDNARNAAQVAPLLPGTGRSAVLVTSRHDLSGLPGARVVRLGLLSRAEGLELLRATVGSPRVDAEPESAELILDACGLLPLALRIAAGRLAARLTWPLAHLAGLLQDERHRLDQLETHEVGVRAGFDVSIDDLLASDSARDRRAAAAFALFGVPEVQDLTVEIVARLLDSDLYTATDALEDLCDLHLLESLAPGRYRLHDLLRVYAKDRAQSTISAPDRAAAITRVVDLHASAAWQALEHAFPNAGRLPWFRSRTPVALGGPQYEDMSSALSWLNGQRPHLVALITQAARTDGVPAVSILRLAIGLHTFYATRGHWLDCLKIYRTALAVAGDDPYAEGFLRNDLGLVLFDLAKAGAGPVDDCVAELQHSLRLFDELAEYRGSAMALANLSHVLDLLGEYQEAIHCGEHALRTYQKLDDPLGEALAYFNIGNSEGKLGRAAAQRAAYDRSIALSIDHRSDHHLAIALLGSGVAYRETGDLPAAIDQLGQAVSKFRALNDQVQLAESLDELGTTHHLLGDRQTAIAHHEEALAISTQYDDGRRRTLILEHLARGD
ncbi:XRE family transcriptional regulator [Kribbella sp. CA-293567]|uniref:XRE family transcriptional regulator n=1 Tax=Kribbella sp. CA-293567 TaxID=3002436 RepID=UPI0022DDDF6C|nr:XRE family transcriptional regulator [Kribbella sp. CA-293567]WBQ06768.1 tetratricopeptide repeat protein [Kribbella sp. CA-293567]